MKTILVIDDAPAITTALRVRLQASGYAVLTASDGATGLRLAIEKQPDLILTDIWMPVGLGFSLAQRLRARGIAIPLIFLTASRMPGVREAALQLGASAFFEKPFDTEKLLLTINRLLPDPIPPFNPVLSSHAASAI